jgi:hypothetical protein
MAETSTTTYMSLTLPTPGERLGPTWASDLNTALTSIDAHDHASVGRQLGSAAIGIDADLSFTVVTSTSTKAYAATNMKYLGMSLNTDPTALPATSFENILFTGGTAGDLYFNDGSNTQIQLTSAGALNASGVSAISFSASSTNISTDTTVSVSDDLSYYPVDASGTGSITITLPSAPSGGRFFIFKDISGNAATKNILIRASGTSQMVDGKKSTDTPGGYVINSNYGAATVISRGNSLDFDVI